MSPSPELNVIIDELKSNNHKTLDALTVQLSKIRTGRASPMMLDGISVSYYGSKVPLNQVASISVPEPRMIVIQPFDKSSLGDIEKAIHASNLGISPNNDGNIIRLPIPPLTEDRRKEIAKSVKKYGEECKVSMRKHRKQALDNIRMAEKSKDVSEDDAKKIGVEIQKTIDDSIAKIDKIVAAKEESILSI